MMKSRSFIFLIILFCAKVSYTGKNSEIIKDLAVRNSLKQLDVFKEFDQMPLVFSLFSNDDIKQIRLSHKEGADASERAKNILWGHLLTRHKATILYHMTGILGYRNLSAAFGKDLSAMTQGEFFAAVETAKGMANIDFDATHPLGGEPALISDEMSEYLIRLQNRAFLAIKAFPVGQDDSVVGGITGDLVAAISGVNDTGYRCSYQDLGLIMKHAYFPNADAPGELRMGQQVEIQVNFNSPRSTQSFLDREIDYDSAFNIRLIP